MQDSENSMRNQVRTTIARFPSAFRRRDSMFSAVRQIIKRQGWMESPADSLQSGISKVVEPLGRDAMDVLHGTWLEHPLHPALTDVPIGAATTCITLDAIGSATQGKQLQGAADAALAVAVVSAVPTATAGIADWLQIQGMPRRVGLVHASLNITSLLLNLASLVFRFSGRRKTGVALSSMAYLATSGAAWLGGQLVYEDGVGVDHSIFRPGPKDFTMVMPETELREGVLHKVEVNGTNVLLFRRGNEIWAIGDTCAHQGCSLSEGHLEDDAVRCPCHGSTYSLRDGHLIHGPSTYDQPGYEVRIWNGQIYVRQAPKFQQAA